MKFSLNLKQKVHFNFVCNIKSKFTALMIFWHKPFLMQIRKLSSIHFNNFTVLVENKLQLDRLFKLSFINILRPCDNNRVNLF